MGSVQILFLLCSLTLLQVGVLAAPQHQTNRNSPDYSVTHLDIRDAILSLVSVLRDQMDKLERHEVRERQLGEQLTRSLATLEKRGRGEEKNIENIAGYIARIDEKVKNAQQSLDKHSEQTRSEAGQLMTLIAQAGSGGNEGLEKKLDFISEQVTELRRTGDSNSAKFDTLLELWKSSSPGSSTTSSDLNDSLITDLAEIKDLLSKLSESKLSGGSQEFQSEIMESLDSQRRQLAVLEEEIGKAVGLLGEMTSSAADMNGALSSLSSSSITSLLNSTEALNTLTTTSFQSLSSRLDSLSSILSTSLAQLSNELKGLANVESVLLDTGDSVLDTKRRLEYGVQQILGEIQNQLTISSGNLNASLQSRFDSLATSVLANQSSALTNLTSRMEEEISQVWRQIGILYHQMSKSATILDEIHSQTSQYVNNSMDTMSSMDGKVGQITSQMAGVDDNLNYLLGRMSLVVQEFNMIKGGLGDALVSLRESFTELGEVEKLAGEASKKAEGEGQSEIISRGGAESSENEIRE